MATAAPAAPVADNPAAQEQTAWERLRAYVATPPAPPVPAEEPEEPAADAPEDEDEPQPQGKGKRAGFLGAVRSSRFSELVGRVASVRTPGGLLPLVLAILFFLFAIVPANATGESRIQLLWRVLTGGAFLPQSAAARLRDAETQRINDDNAAAAQVARAAGNVATTAGQLVDATGHVVQAAQTGWDVFWTGTEMGVTILEEHL